jgi:hypothetical protein
MITTRILTNDNFVVSKEILKRIKDETKPHGLCVYIQAILAGINTEFGPKNEMLNPFYNGIEANWKHLFAEIMSDSALSQSIVDVINYDTIKEADNLTGGLIQEYIDSVNKLVKNVRKNVKLHYINKCLKNRLYISLFINFNLVCNPRFNVSNKL